MVTVIDYHIGNTGSVKNAVEWLGYDVRVSNKIRDIKKATHLILPGVGAFDEGMKNLKKLNLDKILTEEVFGQKKPLMGLCLGMQLLADIGAENGEMNGLGWISGIVRKFNVEKAKIKLPHVGWNDVKPKADSLLFKDVKKPIFYFVHSYIYLPKDKGVIEGKTYYGETFAAAIRSKNIFGLQFHPEKSQQAGLKVLDNFLNWKNS